MEIFSFNAHTENKVIRFGIILFWWIFWLFNVADKFLANNAPFWAGRDRVGQFNDYFTSIGITDPSVALVFLTVIVILEIMALIFATLALSFFISGDKKHARGSLFWSILTALVIFSAFTIGDQIFGDRFELLEHSLYWITLILSWFVYTHAD